MQEKVYYTQAPESVVVKVRLYLSLNVFRLNKEVSLFQDFFVCGMQPVATGDIHVIVTHVHVHVCGTSHTITSIGGLFFRGVDSTVKIMKLPLKIPATQ